MIDLINDFMEHCLPSLTLSIHLRMMFIAEGRTMDRLSIAASGYEI
jgi:hypothetical protein